MQIGSKMENIFIIYPTRKSRANCFLLSKTALVFILTFFWFSLIFFFTSLYSRLKSQYNLLLSLWYSTLYLKQPLLNIFLTIKGSQSAHTAVTDKGEKMSEMPKQNNETGNKFNQPNCWGANCKCIAAVISYKTS